MRKLGLGLASYVLLAACGGGHTDGEPLNVIPGSPTPSSSPTPTPTPTPTPSATALNTGEIKPAADAVSIAATMELNAAGGTANELTPRATDGPSSNRSFYLDPPGFALRYDATTGYRLADAMSNVTFGPAELTADTTSTDRFFPSVQFTKLAPPVADYLLLYKEMVEASSNLGSASTLAKYGGIAGWQHTVTSTNSAQSRITYFAFGSSTPANSMPRSGVVKFGLTGVGNFAGDTSLYFASHFNTVTVDFGTGTFIGEIAAIGQNSNGSVGGAYDFTLTGNIVGNAITGAIISGVRGNIGNFRLLFVGPNADELIIIYAGKDNNSTYVGSSIGLRNPYLQ